MGMFDNFDNKKIIPPNNQIRRDDFEHSHEKDNDKIIKVPKTPYQDEKGNIIWNCGDTISIDFEIDGMVMACEDNPKPNPPSGNCDCEPTDLTDYATIEYVDEQLLIESEIRKEKDDCIDLELANKQVKLISGENLKTINGESILGPGDIEISNEDVVVPTIFIRYSAYSDGKDYSETWDNTKIYLGVAVSKELPTSKEEYRWVRIVGDYVNLEEDTSSLDIFYKLQDKTDKTYKADNIYNFDIIIPEEIEHGFYSGLNIKSSSIPPIFKFTNNSIYPLKKIFFGIEIGTFFPRPNRTILMSFMCDGINVYCYINEV